VQHGRTFLPLVFAPHQSWFVVFREPATPPAQAPPAGNFPGSKVLLELRGPWEVSFPPGWGAPERISFPQLTDWTKRPEPGIQHFSGTATYRKSFELPASAPRTPQSALFLDLGRVRDLASVRLNGQELATLWMEPWRVDITAAVKPGVNTLEIEVANVWHNRLVGDAALPAEQQRTWPATPKRLQLKTPLLEAGLLGPATVQAEGR
jgi:hypothetical protein